MMLGRKESLSALVVKHLADKITTGVYQPGDQIPIESELCTEYGVSRTVIREAVASLRADGLLVSKQGIGVFVSSAPKAVPFEISPDPNKLTDIIYVLELRLSVEVEAAALAAERHTESQLQNIYASFEEIDKEILNVEGDRGHADYQFHMAIARAANNPYYQKFLQFLGPLIIPRIRLAGLQGANEAEQGYHKFIQQQHLKIIQAIEKRNAKAAREAMRAHLSTSLDRYKLLAIEKKG